MYKPKIAVIGCGGFGRLHSDSIKKIDIFDIIAYADINGKAAEECCNRYNAKYFSEDYRKVLEDREIEAVFICTTHDSHHPISMDAIAAGKHVFVEKPLAMTVEQCEDIKRSLSGKDLKFMVGHKMRFSPNIRKLKEEVKKPVSIIAQMMDNRWSDSIWQQDPVKGGGNVLSQGCHVFDIITYIAGDLPDTIYAEGGTLTHSGTAVIDNIVAAIRFRNGVIASVAIGDAGVDVYTTKTMVQVFTGNGCIVLTNGLMRYGKYAGQDVYESELASDYTDEKTDPQGFYAEIMEFRNCITDGKAPLVGVNEGTNAIKMVYAVFDSIRSGMVQKF